MITTNVFRKYLVGTIFFGALILLTSPISQAAEIVLHGATIAKGCNGPKTPGDTVDCEVRVGYNDEAGDTISIDEVWDVMDFGGDSVRVPAAGNLEIVGIAGNTTCTVGGALPCLIGASGSILSGLPGTAGNGLVTFASNTYVIESDDPDPLVDQGNAKVHDLCDARGTTGCVGVVNNIQFASGTDLIYDTEVTTEVHDPAHADITNTSVAAGTTVHDEATLASLGGVPTGTVDFKRFTTIDCTGDFVEQNNVPLVAGVAESSDFVTNPGFLSYMVHYDGSDNFNPSDGVCEPLTIEKFPPRVTTEVHDPAHTDVTNGSVPVGTTIHDEATVAGDGPEPTGTVDFARFANLECTGEPADVQNDVALVAGVAESSDYLTTVVGGVSYMVTYGGDNNYDSGEGICEPIEARKLPSGVTTEVHNPAHEDITGGSVDTGTVVHDKAIVNGLGPTPTGTVDFARFATNNCTGEFIAQDDVVLGLDGTAESDDFVSVPDGLSYVASYDGDAIYEPSLGICEPLDVEKLDPEVRTDIHDDAHAIVTEVDAGTDVHDKVFVLGTGPTPTGTADFMIFANLACEGDPVSTEPDLALDSSANPAVVESGVTSALADMAYMAHYDGDTNYNPMNGACEPLVVRQLGCTLTQGYWKTHEENWPVDSLTLGTVNYTQEELLSILTTPVKGNGLISLAHQLIAAKLNIADGASLTDVATTIEDADTLIGGLVIPPVGTGKLTTNQVSSLVGALDDFNNGDIGPGHCGE